MTATFLYTSSFSSPTPWALPLLRPHPRILMTPTRIARLQARWASPTGNFVALVTNWSGGSANATNGLGFALKYLATGNATFATSAYNAAIAESYALEKGGPWQLWANTSPIVLDWCYSALTGTQKANLIAQIETQNGNRETSLNSAGTAGYQLMGPANGTGLTGYTMGCLAIEGEAGASSRIAKLRNGMQHTALWLDESHADGGWDGYSFLGYWNALCLWIYHIAAGEESLAIGRVPYLGNRGGVAARQLVANLSDFIAGPTNHRANTNGVQFEARPEEGWAAAFQADCAHDPVMQWVCDGQQTNASFRWTHTQLLSDASWMALPFYDSTLIAQSPATAGLPLCTALTVSGLTNFRGGWNLASGGDINAWYFTGACRFQEHDKQNGGHLEIWRGADQIVSTGYNYAGRNSGWESFPAGANTVGNYSMTLNCMLFSPTGSATPDKSGSQKCSGSQPSGSVSTYPWSNGLIWFAGGGTWLNSKLLSFVDEGNSPGDEALTIGDLSNAYLSSQVTNYKRYVDYVKGADSTRGTFVVRDTFTAGSVNRIRALFYARQAFNASGKVVVTGGLGAGVLTCNNDVNTVRGASKVWYQMVSPSPTVVRLVGGGDGLGGAGDFTNYYDGANTSFHLNFQGGTGDSRNTVETARIANQWRVEFETTPGAAQGQVVIVITIGDSGDADPPVYTLSDVQALAPLAFPGGPAPGGPVSTYPAPPFPSNENRVLFRLEGANFNTTADQPLQQVGYLGKYRINKITVLNPSLSLTTAAGGFYTGASKGGKTLVAAGQSYAALNGGATGTLLDCTLATGATGNFFVAGTVPILSLTTPQGAAATADIEIEGTDLT